MTSCVIEQRLAPGKAVKRATRDLASINSRQKGCHFTLVWGGDSFKTQSQAIKDPCFSNRRNTYLGDEKVPSFTHFRIVPV